MPFRNLRLVFVRSSRHQAFKPVLCFPSTARSQPGAIIAGFLTLPHVVTYFTNKYIMGNPYKRKINNIDEIHHFLRDIRVGDGNAYKQVGLESLSLEEEK